MANMTSREARDIKDHLFDAKNWIENAEDYVYFGQTQHGKDKIQIDLAQAILELNKAREILNR